MTKAIAELGLQQLESIIENWLPAFIEVGNALREIRDRNLYKQSGYERWEDYCRERWGVSRSYAHKTIEASRVAGMLPMGNVRAPLHERLIRPLAVGGLSDEQRLEAWEAARETADQDGELVQEKHVRFAVDHLFDKHPNGPPSLRIGPDGEIQVMTEAGPLACGQFYLHTRHEEALRAIEYIKSRCHIAPS